MRPELQHWPSSLVPQIFDEFDHFLHAASAVQDLSLQIVEIQLELLLVAIEFASKAETL